MKKINLIISLLICYLTISAQTESITFESAEPQLNKLEKAVYQNFADKNYTLLEARLKESINLFSQLSKEDQEQRKYIQSGNYYNLTCLYSLQKKKKQAIDAFDSCINNWGYTNYMHANSDSDLDYIRNEKRFVTLIQSIREKGDYIYMLQKGGEYQTTNTIGLPLFTYEEATNRRLMDVKSLFNLDSIAGQGDEISQIINLMTWLHNTIRHDGGNWALCEFDVIDFYNYHKATGKGVNCRALSIALNECYLAMGFKSRYITCMPKREDDPDCHVINCVYSNTLKKWLWMDPTFNAYIKDENGTLLSIEEVRERLINGKTLILNDDANWNNQVPQTKDYYIDSYMAKNLYWLECPVVSKFNPESRYRNNTEIYVSIRPLGYERSANKNIKEVIIHDPAYFWQAPQ